MNIAVSPGSNPALVLNADYRPLSYYPLSLWSWQDAIKAVFLERVNIVSEYETAVRSPSFSMKLPSVVSLKTYVKPARHPAFTRFNVFLRDRFACQYCGTREDLTFDHLVPRSRGGQTTWDNVVAACSSCNLKKGGLSTREARMWPSQMPFQPTVAQLHNNGRHFPPNYLHEFVDGLPLLGYRAGAVGSVPGRSVAVFSIGWSRPPSSLPRPCTPRTGGEDRRSSRQRRWLRLNLLAGR